MKATISAKALTITTRLISKLITIDFETYSEIDLMKQGAFKYAEHESTEVLCLRYKFPGSDEVKLWIPEDFYNFDELPEDLFEAVENGEPIEAHNASFEWVIWNWVCTRLYGFPELKNEILHCSAAKAATLAMPRKLETLGKALNAKAQKDLEGHLVMKQVSKPKKPSKKDPSTRYTPINAPEKFEKLYSYCGDDVLSEESASELLPPLPTYERQVYLLDQKINQRGIYCDIDLVKVAMKFAKRYETEMIEELKEVTGGQVQTGKQVAKIRSFLSGEGCDLENLQADTVEEALKSLSLTEKARRVLEIRSRLGKSATTKFAAMLRMACKDNRIRGTLLYHGASTGRWTGKGIQPQNFIKGSVKDLKTLFDSLEMRDYDFFSILYPNILDALASATRGMLRAPPGHDFIAGDFNAIEARAVFWLAGCEEGLKVFRRGDDIYIDMASTIYKIDVSKLPKRERDPKRQLGKQAILGLGFGMGVDKFIYTCLGYGMEVDRELGKLAVNVYRSRFVDIKDYWYGVEKAAIRAVKTGQVIKYKNLKFGVKGRWLYIQLPSGRKLAYYNPKVRPIKTEKFGTKDTLTYMAMNSSINKWVRERTYGGKLVENITQATARDLMVNGMFNLEKAGYKIVFTVHDEIIAEVPKGFGSVEEFEGIMSELPPWAKDFPIKSEAWRGERYKK